MNSDGNRKIKGSFVYENWQDYLSGEPLNKTFEHPLYSDSHIVGSMPRFKSPYYIFLTYSENVNDTSIPAMILRSGMYSEYDMSVVRETNIERYHGGVDSDEIAALISLCLGIRVKAGPL